MRDTHGLTLLIDTYSNMRFLFYFVIGCLSRMRPRYKRLVDNIFPSVPQVCKPTMIIIVSH